MVPAKGFGSVHFTSVSLTSQPNLQGATLRWRNRLILTLADCKHYGFSLAPFTSRLNFGYFFFLKPSSSCRCFLSIASLPRSLVHGHGSYSHRARVDAPLTSASHSSISEPSLHGASLSSTSGFSSPSSPAPADAVPLCPVCALTSSSSCSDCDDLFCARHVYRCTDCGNQFCGGCFDSHLADGHWDDSNTAAERTQHLPASFVSSPDLRMCGFCNRVRRRVWLSALVGLRSFSATFYNLEILARLRSLLALLAKQLTLQREACL